jgi:hypothetical protein
MIYIKKWNLLEKIKNLILIFYYHKILFFYLNMKTYQNLIILKKEIDNKISNLNPLK